MSPRRAGFLSLVSLIVGTLEGPCPLFALDSHKELTQYTHAVWTRAQGLPQDTIRTITQTEDGYLWLGTNEGLARFDGYDFVTFTKGDGSLPSQRIRKLWAGRNGNLWIGTMGGLVRYSGGHFKTFTAQDGLPPDKIDALIEDHLGVVWVISGESLSYLDKDRFITYPKQRLALTGHPQVLYEDQDQQLWVASTGSVLKRTATGFSVVVGPEKLRGDTVTSLLKDASGLWIGGTNGILLIKPDGSSRRFTTRDGLPNNFVRALCKDRSGNLWVGTYGGLSRFEHGRFTSSTEERQDRDWVWCMYEDREGDLWIGMNSALARLSDSRFSMYGRPEGLPSDEANVVHQDGHGEIWVGYHSSGLVGLRSRKSFTTRDGLPSNEIFSLHNARNGDQLISTLNGLSRMHEGRFLNYSVPDPLGRKPVYSALEDARGHLWASNASGVYEFLRGAWHPIALSHSNANDFTVALTEGPDGTLWAGTLGSGLEQIQNTKGSGVTVRRFTREDGLGSNEIRSLYADSDGALWIGTLDGGLTEFRDGAFHRYTARDGLLSDNISHIQDDGRGSLWLSTTRGLCRIAKQQLRDFSAGKIRILKPENFGTADGLRSTQCGPGAPAGSGATQTPDGRLWFPTSGGVASIDPQSDVLSETPKASLPAVHIVQIAADGHDLDLSRKASLRPGTGRIEFRYTGIYLNAPERVRYSYKLEGLDHDWVPAGSRREIDYSPLPHGKYRFLVRAALPEGEVSESQFAFEVLPHFFEAGWFFSFCSMLLAGGIYGAYRLRLNQVHARFALVSAERARMAREIHDTLAQGFVGISAQLDALAVNWQREPKEAWQHLDLARRMARHSLTEARRSVLDLRASELEELALPEALAAAARRCTAGNPVQVRLQIAEIPRKLTTDLEQNLLRIVQEAVTNAVKHAKARMIQIELVGSEQFLHLRIKDDGQGFEPSRAFSVLEGHFGILGMRERAERLGGDFALASRPGSGTELEVRVPLCSVRSTS